MAPIRRAALDQPVAGVGVAIDRRLGEDDLARKIAHA